MHSVRSDEVSYIVFRSERCWRNSEDCNEPRLRRSRYAAKSRCCAGSRDRNFRFEREVERAENRHYYDRIEDQSSARRRFESAANNAIGAAKSRQNTADFKGPHYARNEFDGAICGPAVIAKPCNSKPKPFFSVPMNGIRFAPRRRR